jgi:putative addiction module component (TIGR02574 family)
MQTNEIVQAIDKLELSEKLLLVGAIWDGIARHNSLLPLPEWQKAELDNRQQAYARGEMKARDAHSVHEAIRSQYKAD